MRSIIAIVIPVIIPAAAHPAVGASSGMVVIIPIAVSAPVTRENPYIGADRRVITENVSMIGCRSGTLVYWKSLDTKGKSSTE